MSEHTTIREQDEYYCTKCGKRWDVNEEAPECEEEIKNVIPRFYKCR